jgi:hypothetical protein
MISQFGFKDRIASEIEFIQSIQNESGTPSDRNEHENTVELESSAYRNGGLTQRPLQANPNSLKP